MTCPRCYSEFEHAARACPECGVRLMRNVSGVMKISAVMIASGEGQSFFRSVQDVPEPLRAQLVDVTTSSNSGTIVIADRAGKEQITQVIARRETARDRAAGEGAAHGAVASRFLEFSFLGLPGIAWVGAALFLAASGVIATVFVTHW